VLVHFLADPMSTNESAPATEGDPLREIALQIYIELVSRVYADPGATPDRPKPQPQILAQMSFKFAEAFLATDLKVNPKAIASRAAAEKAGVNVAEMVMDFEKLGKSR